MRTGGKVGILGAMDKHAMSARREIKKKSKMRKSLGKRRVCGSLEKLRILRIALKNPGVRITPDKIETARKPGDFKIGNGGIPRNPGDLTESEF